MCVRAEGGTGMVDKVDSSINLCLWVSLFFTMMSVLKNQLNPITVLQKPKLFRLESDQPKIRYHLICLTVIFVVMCQQLGKSVISINLARPPATITSILDKEPEEAKLASVKREVPEVKPLLARTRYGQVEIH